MADDPLAGLREALSLSPDNEPLRLHVARALTSAGRDDEALELLKDGVKRLPASEGLKLELARAYHRRGNTSAALVIVEDLLSAGESPAALVLHARLLLASGEAGRAARQYRRAVDLDPTRADEELAEELGVSDDPVERETAEVVGGRRRARAGDAVERPSGVGLQRPTITFADVGGMEALKEEIRLKIIYPLTRPEIYAAYGKRAGGGILLYGPPGCGKTLLARATAGEVDASFMAVGINDVLDMWIGNSEKNLHRLFELARANTPCVLFFDEVDALGASRRDMRQAGGRHVINQFLAELDGVAAANEGVLVLAATNAPWHLDSAFRRPGRFDRIVFVPPPDAPARKGILELLLREKPQDGLALDKVARQAERFSGADLKAVVDRAVEERLQEALRHGVPQPIRQKDLLTALKTVRPSTREWFATARNYALYSNEGGVYDDLLPYLE